MRIEAFVIKKQATNELDELVVLYTKEFGRIESMAKSILKADSIQGMHVNVLNLIHCDLVEGRGLPIITGAYAEATFPILKSNLSSLAIAGYLCESIDKMTYPFQSDLNIWSFLSASFTELNKPSNHNRKTLLRLGSELLSVFGYSPNTEQCTFCSRSDQNYVAFSPELVGVICADCFLTGRRGVIFRKGENPVDSSLKSIFESLTGTNFYSLTFAEAVLQ